MTVPYTFGTATTSIPLSNLDANFNTPITLGNTSIYLGNTTTTIGNLTLTNATISSGTVNITNVTVTTANVTNITVTGTANIATGNVTTLTSTSITDSGLTSGRVTIAGTGGLLTDSANLTFNGSLLSVTGSISSTLGANIGLNSGIGLQVNSTVNSVNQAFTSTTTGTQANYISLSNTGGQIFFGIDSNAGASLGSGFVYGTVLASPTNLQFQIGGTNRFIISSAGNVGIGTSSPLARFGVAGGESDFTSLSTFSSRVNIGADATNAFVRSYDSTGGILIGTANATPIKFIVDSSERMRIDTSGNLGLGVTPNSSWSALWSAEQFGQAGSLFAYKSGSNYTVLSNNSYTVGGAYQSGDGRYINTGYSTAYIQNNSGEHQWLRAASGTAGNAISFTQAMTLDASGNLLVGCTSAPSSSVSGVIVKTGGVEISAGSGTGLTYLMAFINGNGTVGNINVNGSTTTYATSSDYRLKNTIAPMTGALAKVALLKPVTYKWNSDGSNGEGFIAHELAEVVPDCVTGEKDAVDAEGNPKYQGIDTSFLVATLVSAIQELKAEFDAYKATHP